MNHLLCPLIISCRIICSVISQEGIDLDSIMTQNISITTRNVAIKKAIK